MSDHQKPTPPQTTMWLSPAAQPLAEEIKTLALPVLPVDLLLCLDPADSARTR